jgi:hypothetical protein
VVLNYQTVAQSGVRNMLRVSTLLKSSPNKLAHGNEDLDRSIALSYEVSNKARHQL